MEFFRWATKEDKNGNLTYQSRLHEDNGNSILEVRLDPKLREILDSPQEMSEQEFQQYDLLKTQKEKKQFKLGLEIIYDYCFSPLTIEQACNSKGITARTFQRWVKKMSFLSDFYFRSKSLKKQIDNDHIEENLKLEVLRMASGYNIELPTIYYNIIEDSRGVLHRIPYKMIVRTKHVRKNVRAAIFWLRNHCPDEYPYG